MTYSSNHPVELYKVTVFKWTDTNLRVMSKQSLGYCLDQDYKEEQTSEDQNVLQKSFI